MTCGVVLAGGRARRMGGAKAGLLLRGRPLAAYPLEALRAGGCRPLALVAPAGVALPDLGVPVWEEPDGGPRHPGRGIVAALERAAAPVIALACDLPFVTPAVVAWLIEQPGGTLIPALDGRPEPLLARWDPAELDALRAAVRDRTPLHRLATATPAPFAARVATNINTRAELEAACSA